MTSQFDKQRVSSELAATPFRPAWWARGGLLQTLASMRPARPMPALRREILATPDDDELQLHWADGSDARSPAVLVLHGLEGSRRSSYVREVLHHARQRGWHAAVLEFRSCSETLNRARRTYHSGETSDFHAVLAHVCRRLPRSSWLAVGFSLGANVLLKALGERPAAIPRQLHAAAAISPPFDLAVCASQCDRRFRGAITRHFLRTLVPKARAKERQFPGLFDVSALARCRTFRAFDDLVTAPTHGFRDADHYYTSQSCGRFLADIRVPTLLIAAMDDPLSLPQLLPREQVASSPVLVPQFVAQGGHVAFVDGGWPLRPRRWAEAQAMRFFDVVLRRDGGTPDG